MFRLLVLCFTVFLVHCGSEKEEIQPPPTGSEPSTSSAAPPSPTEPPSSSSNAPAGWVEYRSSFGFSTHTPPGWMVLSREESRKNPDLFANLSSNPDFENMDSGLLKQVQEQIQSGQIEMLFSPEQPGTSFADNINVLKQIGQLPAEGDLEATCAQLPGAFEQYFGRPIEFFECSLGQAAGMPALYLDFDGALEGTRSAQYQIQKTGSVKLIVTVTAANDRFASVHDTFKRIVDGMTIGD